MADLLTVTFSLAKPSIVFSPILAKPSMVATLSTMSMNFDLAQVEDTEGIEFASIRVDFSFQGTS